MSANNGKLLEGVLVAFSYGLMAGTKRDAALTEKICEENNAGDGAGTWSNKLFPPKACGAVNAYTILRKHLGQMRNFTYANTFIFEDSIWRVLPEKRIELFKQVVGEDGKQRAKELLEDFIDALPLLKEMAKQPKPVGRGEFFRESDYPTPDQIREQFHYTVDYRPIPTGSGLNPALMQEAIDKLNQLHQQRLLEANTSLVERFIAPFKTLEEQLKDPEGRKLKTVWGSILEICDMIPTLELAGNSELVTAATQMKELFSKISPEMVKKDEAMQKMMGNTASSVLANGARFGGFGRKFS